MNKTLTTAEVNDLSTPWSPPMTRDEKLRHWASIVRKGSMPIFIFHRLEHRTPFELNAMAHPGSAFALAAADPVFQQAGLADDTIGASMRFFEMGMDALHAFSCDCSGTMTNARMADIIEGMAGPQAPSMWDRTKAAMNNLRP